MGSAVSIDQVCGRFPSVEICESLMQLSSVNEQGEREDCFLPVVCLRQLHDGVVEIEELVDNLGMLHPVEDRDDSNIGDEVFGPNRWGFVRRGFPNALGLLELAVFEGDDDVGGVVVEDDILQVREALGVKGVPCDRNGFFGNERTCCRSTKERRLSPRSSTGERDWQCRLFAPHA